MKKIIALLLVLVMALGLMGCNKKTLHCDGCGKEVKCDSKMDEEWIVFCSDCEPEIDWD